MLNKDFFKILALIVMCRVGTSVGQIPQFINYQGMLTDGSGNPVDGARSIQFCIYDVPAGGTALWSETQTVTVQEGLFSVLLGSLSPIPFAVFNGAETYLALKVGDDQEMTPRKRLVSVAYSFRANDADHVKGKDIPAIVSSVDSVANDGGNIDLVAGSNITIMPNDATNTITIAATGIGGGDITAVNAGAGLIGGGRSGDVTLDVAQNALTSGMIQNNTILGEDINSSTTITAVRLQGGWTTVEYASVSGTRESGYGVYGSCKYGDGVYGSSTSGYGVRGESTSGYGVRGESTSGTGVYGASNSGTAVFGYRPYGNYAGDFSGNVRVQGTFSKTAGSFKIDHPLDPENKYLQHSFVESPDMMNIYNGNVILDLKGEANVELPVWFEALNQDFRYQLTPIGAPGPNLYVADEISENKFRIAGGTPGMKVSWQATGIRHDAYANAHRIEVEEEKTGNERGKYLQPKEYGQPESMGIGYEERLKMAGEGGQP